MRRAYALQRTGRIFQDVAEGEGADGDGDALEARKQIEQAFITTVTAGKDGERKGKGKGGRKTGGKGDDGAMD